MTPDDSWWLMINYDDSWWPMITPDDPWWPWWLMMTHNDSWWLMMNHGESCWLMMTHDGDYNSFKHLGTRTVYSAFMHSCWIVWLSWLLFVGSWPYSLPPKSKPGEQPPLFLGSRYGQMVQLCKPMLKLSSCLIKSFNKPHAWLIFTQYIFKTIFLMSTHFFGKSHTFWVWQCHMHPQNWPKLRHHSASPCMVTSISGDKRDT